MAQTRFAAALVLAVLNLCVQPAAAFTGRCEDVYGFTDQLGLGCSDWAQPVNCSDIAEALMMGYNVSGVQQVMNNCPVTCGLCTPTPWVTVEANSKVIKVNLTLSGVDFSGVSVTPAKAIQVAIGAALGINATDATEFSVNGVSLGRRLATAYVAIFQAVVPSTSTTRTMLDKAGTFGTAGAVRTAFVNSLTSQGANVAAIAIQQASPQAATVQVLRNSLTAAVLGVLGVSVPVTPWCQDDPTFLDELGEDCSGWVGYDCTNTDRWTGSERPYTTNGLARALKWCPVSCGFCQPPNRPTEQALLTTCQDDPLVGSFCARFRGLNCQWAADMGYPDTYQALLLAKCPLTCGLCTPSGGAPVCRDTPNFLDARGRTCSQWAHVDCGLEVPGYSRAAVMQVQINCPASCKFCDPLGLQPAAGGSAMPAVPGYWGSLGNDTGLMHSQCKDDPDYTYIKLYGCSDFIGKECTIGTLYLDNRWMMGPRGSGVGPWGAWRWHKPLWQACPVSCGHCSPPKRPTPADLMIECQDDVYYSDWCKFRWSGQDCKTWQSVINVALPEEVDLYNTTIFSRCPLSCKLCKPPPCPPGTFRDTIAHTCTPCPLGTYAATVRAGPTATKCEEVMPGDYVETVGAKDYERCEPGYFNPTKGGTNCSACPAGTYTDMFSASECTSCDKGWYQESENATGCKRCEPGSYTNETGMSECYTCPVERTTFFQGAADITECGCPQDTYQPVGREATPCEPCPMGMRCPGGHRYLNASFDWTAKLKAGFMSLPADPYVVYTCVEGNVTCPEERDMPMSDQDILDFMCAESRFGVRCASCPEKTYSYKGQCKPCEGKKAGEDATWKAFIAAFILLYGTFLAYRRQGKEQPAAWMMFVAFIYFVQVIQTLTMLPLDWPDELKPIFEVISIISINGFFYFFEFRHDCIFGPQPFTYILRDAIIPLLPFANFILIFLLVRPFKKVHFPFVMNVIACAFTGLFITISQAALELFPYEQMPPPNTKRFVRATPGLEMYTPEWYRCLPVALVATGVYCGGTLVYITRAIIIAPRRIAASAAWGEQYNFMLGDINPTTWWWIAILMLYGLGLQLVQAVTGDIFAQLYISMLLIKVYLLLQLGVQPNVFRAVNWLEVLFAFASLAFLIFATAFFKVSDLELQDSEVHAWVMLACLNFVGAFTVISLIIWVRKAFLSTPIGKAAHVAFRGRDIMTLLAQMPEAEFLGRASHMLESDRMMLKRATDLLVGVFLGEQPSTKLMRSRVQPAAEYKIWDPASTISEALRQVHSREAHDALEESAKLRMQVKTLAGELRTKRIGPVSMEHRIHHQRLRALKSQEKKKVGEKVKAVAHSVPGAAYFEHFRKQVVSIFLDPGKCSRMTLEEFVEEAREFSSLDADQLTRIFTIFDMNEEGSIGIHDFFHLVSSMAPASGDAFGDDGESSWKEQTEQEEKDYQDQKSEGGKAAAVPDIPEVQVHADWVDQSTREAAVL